MSATVVHKSQIPTCFILFILLTAIKGGLNSLLKIVFISSLLQITLTWKTKSLPQVKLNVFYISVNVFFYRQGYRKGSGHLQCIYLFK